MNRKQTTQRPPESLPQDAVQLGQERGIGKDERLKRVVKQHPQRDEPKVDSVEPGETPATRPSAGRSVPT